MDLFLERDDPFNTWIHESRDGPALYCISTTGNLLGLKDTIFIKNEDGAEVEYGRLERHRTSRDILAVRGKEIGCRDDKRYGNEWNTVKSQHAQLLLTAGQSHLRFLMVKCIAGWKIARRNDVL
jgi:hypothetical protein